MEIRNVVIIAVCTIGLVGCGGGASSPTDEPNEIQPVVSPFDVIDPSEQFQEPETPVTEPVVEVPVIEPEPPVVVVEPMIEEPITPVIGEDPAHVDPIEVVRSPTETPSPLPQGFREPVVAFNDGFVVTVPKVSTFNTKPSVIEINIFNDNDYTVRNIACTVLAYNQWGETVNVAEAPFDMFPRIGDNGENLEAGQDVTVSTSFSNFVPFGIDFHAVNVNCTHHFGYGRHDSLTGLQWFFLG